MKRVSLTPLRRLALFERAGSVCHLCDQRIQVGERWEVEHRIPIAMGGADDETNMSPAHVSRHAVKTKADARNLAKVNRVRAKHRGAWQKSGFKKLPEGYRWSWQLGRAVKEEAR